MLLFSSPHFDFSSTFVVWLHFLCRWLRLSARCGIFFAWWLPHCFKCFEGLISASCSVSPASNPHQSLFIPMQKRGVVWDMLILLHFIRNSICFVHIGKLQIPNIFLCVYFFATPKLRIYFLFSPAKGLFCAAVHLSVLVWLLFCSVTLLVGFCLCWSISFFSSLFTMFRFFFQSRQRNLLCGLFACWSVCFELILESVVP